MSDPIIDHCREVMERGSKTFARAAALLDPVTRAGAYQLYAWGRHCDDVIDGQILGHGQQTTAPALLEERLESLRRDTRQALAGGKPAGPVFEALARVVERHRIPHHHPFELLDGMEMDVRGTRYRTIEELEVYGYRVAGVVAVMMAQVMGIRDPQTLARAANVGTAIQLTNISRDVVDDAANGRVYLPTSWLTEAGVPVDEVGDPRHRAAVARVVAKVLERGDQLYRSGDSGFDELPFRSRWAIAAARWIYWDIGTVIRSRGAAAWDRRAYVGAGKKLYWTVVGFRRAISRSRAPSRSPAAP